MLPQLQLIHRQKGVMPAPLANRPKLEPEDQAYVEAFQCLSAARSYNMSGPNPLAVGEMMAYLRGLTAFDLLGQRKRFVRFMQMMDEAVLAHHADKAEAARKAKAGAQPKGPKKPTG